MKENEDGSKAERGISKERLLSRSVYCKPTILLRGRLWGRGVALKSRDERDEDAETWRAVEGRKVGAERTREVAQPPSERDAR